MKEKLHKLIDLIFESDDKPKNKTPKKTTPYFGAIVGQPEGPQGQSYAIPTDGASLSDIQASVSSFIVYAKAHPHLTFLVTEIGCGTAGYHPMEIAPMFTDAVSVPNIYLPKQFWKYIIK